MRGFPFVVSALVLALTACGGGGNDGGSSTGAGGGGGTGGSGGGGGGGGGTTPPPPPTPVVYGGVATAATLSATNAGMIGSDVMTADRLVHAMRTDDLIQAVSGTRTCDSGSIGVTGNLAGNGTGTVTVTFNACRTGADTVSGAASLNIASADASKGNVATDATLDATRINISGPAMNSDVSGTVRIQINSALAVMTKTLTANIVAQDTASGRQMKTEGLTIVNKYDNVLVPTFYTQSITGKVFDGTLGSVDVTTTTAPYTAPWGPLYFATSTQMLPDWGVINLTGATATGATRASSARVTALALDLAKVQVNANGAVDMNGDPVFTTNARMRWADFSTAVGSDLGDSDGDGMHNSWETAMGLNPSDPSDANGDADGDGFTNLAEYRDGTSAATTGSMPSPVHILWLTDARDITLDTTTGEIDVTVPGGVVVPLNTATRELGAPVPAAAPAALPDTGAFTYTTAGEQIDTATGTVVGTFAGVDPAQYRRTLVLPADSLGRVFYLTPSATPGAPSTTWTLSAYGTNRALISSTDIANVSGRPQHLIRFGNRGLAFQTDIGYVFLVESAPLFQ